MCFTFSATNLKSYYSNSPASASDNPLELRESPDEMCQIYRYGYFKATITIVGKSSRGKDVRIYLGPPSCSAESGEMGAGAPTLFKVTSHVPRQRLLVSRFPPASLAFLRHSGGNEPRIRPTC